MSNKTERAEEAIELFKQAATNYKLAKRWDDSAKAYIECVECDKLCKGGQAAEYYTEAANVKEKVNPACILLLNQNASNFCRRRSSSTSHRIACQT
jgi:alpha-soluble NSF attachment protein